MTFDRSARTADRHDSAHLRTRGIRKYFETSTHWAIEEADLDVAKGEFFSVLGPSGCGKSTLLNLIAGFVAPTEGEIVLSGRSLRGVAPHRRRAAMVFQDYALFPHLTVFENVAFGLRLLGRDAGRIGRRVAELLALIGLERRANSLPSQLSGGEQQRVALARALAVDPEIVLLDEPLSNLDARLRVQMRREIKRILSELGVTVIFVTHDQSEALSVSDRVAVMLAGRIQDVGEPMRVYRQPRTEEVARFVGEGNFLPARVLEGAGTSVRVSLEIEGQAVECAVSPAEGSHPTAGQRGVLFVRPEAMTFGQRRDAHSSLRVRITRLEFQGPTRQYTARVSGISIIAEHLSTSVAWAVGEDVDASWSWTDATFFPRPDGESA